MLVWQTCSDKAEFLFLQRKIAFCICAPLNAYQIDVWFVRYISVRSLGVMHGINRVGPLLPWYTILRFRESIPQCLKRPLSNFNTVASQNFIYGLVTLRLYGTIAKPANRPLSAVIANLVTEDVEQRALASSPMQPLFWKRYFDDVISAQPRSQGFSPPRRGWPPILSSAEKSPGNEVDFCGIHKWRGTPSFTFEFGRAVYPVHLWTWERKIFALSWFKCS